MICRIPLAFDDSESASMAFDVAAEMAQRYQAQPHVPTVAPTPGIGEDVDTEAAIEHARNAHEKLLHGLKHRGERWGIQPHLELAVGHPARQILERDERGHADLIVVGHRGCGAFERWRLGSVTQRIIGYARCPVLVVR